MMRSIMYAALAGVGFAAVAAAPVSAMPRGVAVGVDTQVTLAAQGCGPGRWRGPWGGCRDTPYYGPLPYGGYAAGDNGCPPGFWRGPWGNCRNTPYHGPLPGGGWQ